MKTRYPVSNYLERKFQHLHAAVALDSAKSYLHFIKHSNGKMIVTLADDSGATDIGKTLAPMIRAGMVHAIVTTGSVLEADLTEIATTGIGDSRIPRRTVTALHDDILDLWRRASKDGHRYFHWEIIGQLLKTGKHNTCYQQLPAHSWLNAACEFNIPVYTPGIENTTIGRLFCADVVRGKITTHSTMKSGTEQFAHLCNWYLMQQKKFDIGLFQIGDGVTADFSRSVVSSIIHDHKNQCKRWRYSTHIRNTSGSSTDSRSSLPCMQALHFTEDHDIENPENQTFNIDGDTGIIAPLIFNYILEQWSRLQNTDLLSRTLSKVNYG